MGWCAPYRDNLYLYTQKYAKNISLRAYISNYGALDTEGWEKVKTAGFLNVPSLRHKISKTQLIFMDCNIIVTYSASCLLDTESEHTEKISA